MTLIKEVNLIEVAWDGPFTPEEIVKAKKKKTRGKGLYQICGAHELYGSDVLLYLGQTTDSFHGRIGSHNNIWLQDESKAVEIYLGRVFNAKKDVNRSIIEAEKLLIYQCQPAYNSSGIADYRQTSPKEHFLVLNLGRKHRLPSAVSSLWYGSGYWDL